MAEASRRPTPLIIAAVALAGLLLSLCSCGLLSVLGLRSGSPTPTAEAVASATARPSATLASVSTAKPPPTATSTPGATATSTSTPWPTDTPEPTATPTPLPSLAPSRPLEVHFVDVGQGDAVLVLAPDGQAALIDAGERASGIVQYLQARGVHRLRLVIATHPHSDHIGGLVDVLQSVPVDTVATNGELHTTLTYERFLDAIAAAQAEYVELRRGDSLRLGSLTLQVLHPASLSGDLNDDSLVLRLEHQQIAFLFTGDVQSAGEASMLAANQPLDTSVLKVAHHGSHSSSSPAFLAAVRPEVAVYTCGMDNAYGHPHAETLAALAAVGAQVFGTDVNGTVVITSDGSGYSVTVARQGQPRAPPPKVEPTVAPTAAPAADRCPYIGNADSKKFHRADCRYVKQMSEANKVCLDSREEAISKGFIPCQVCKP